MTSDLSWFSRVVSEPLVSPPVMVALLKLSSDFDKLNIAIVVAAGPAWLEPLTDPSDTLGELNASTTVPSSTWFGKVLGLWSALEGFKMRSTVLDSGLCAKDCSVSKLRTMVELRNGAPDRPASLEGTGGNLPRPTMPVIWEVAGVSARVTATTRTFERVSFKVVEECVIALPEIVVIGQ